MAKLLALEVRGDAQLIAALNQLSEGQPLAVERGLFRWGEEVMAESKTQYVPVDTGQLRASGFVLTSSLKDVPPGAAPGPDALQMVAARRPDEVTMVMGYGGPATAYALAVHENPRSGKTGGVSPQGKPYKHWARVGQWKYLETPVKNHAARLTEVVAQEVRTLIQRLTRGRPRG